MIEWINLIVSFFRDCFTDILNKIIIVGDSGNSGTFVSLGMFIVAAAIVSMVIHTFWKGAKA